MWPDEQYIDKQKHASVFVNAWEMTESSTRLFLFIAHGYIFAGRT
jgi:hypothetical protein